MIFDIKTLATIDLLVQGLLMATVLGAAYLAKVRHQLIRHCRIIRVVVAIQLLIILFRMLPLMLDYLKNPGLFFQTEMLIHHSLGILLILLWVYINLAVMGRVRVLGRLVMYMRTALLVWGLVFLLGLHLYLRIYVLS
ncbi:MAG: hypothetical protein HY528_04680 [Chloroflexi bacterium]|nr:hypothetical protein [Chloroflexota bacterium]